MLDKEPTSDNCPECGSPAHAGHTPECSQNKSIKEQKESLPAGEVEELKTDEQILEHFEFIRKNYGIAEEETPEQSTKEAKKWMADELSHNDSMADREFQIHFYGIRDDNENLIGSASLSTHIDDEGRKRAHVSMLSVQENHRRKQMENQGQTAVESAADKLTEKRVDEAKQAGCDYLHMFVKRFRPVAMRVKFKEGFLLKKLAPKNDVFTMEKELNDENTLQLSNEQTKIKLDDVSEIESMLENGWVGVQVNNDEPDPTATDPSKWTLTLQKLQTANKI